MHPAARRADTGVRDLARRVRRVGSRDRAGRCVGSRDRAGAASSRDGADRAGLRSRGLWRGPGRHSRGTAVRRHAADEREAGDWEAHLLAPETNQLLANTATTIVDVRARVTTVTTRATPATKRATIVRFARPRP